MSTIVTIECISWLIKVTLCLSYNKTANGAFPDVLHTHLMSF